MITQSNPLAKHVVANDVETERTASHNLAGAIGRCHCGLDRQSDARTMPWNQWPLYSILILAILFPTFDVNAQTFFEDFDGPIDDGTPVEWCPETAWGPGFIEGRISEGDTSEVADGSWVWDPSGNWFMGAFACENSYEDVSLHTQFSLSGHGRASIDARFDGNGYYAATVSDGGRIGFWSLAKYAEEGTGWLATNDARLEPSNNDVHLQFDLLGNSLSLTVWEDGDAKPLTPQILIEDEASSEGSVGLGLRNLDNAGVEFRFFEATSLADSQAGDFDGSGGLDLFDVNKLSWAIVEGFTEDAFDLNDDSRVDQADLTKWVKDLKETWIGDADLDGEFNSADLVAIFQAEKFESRRIASWHEGDWNADRRFDSGDLVAAFQDGGYQSGRLVNTAAVPEPACLALLAVGVLMLMPARHL